jgi:regulator of replication initiation timing
MSQLQSRTDKSPLGRSKTPEELEQEADNIGFEDVINAGGDAPPSAESNEDSEKVNDAQIQTETDDLTGETGEEGRPEDEFESAPGEEVETETVQGDNNDDLVGQLEGKIATLEKRLSDTQATYHLNTGEKSNLTAELNHAKEQIVNQTAALKDYDRLRNEEYVRTRNEKLNPVDVSNLEGDFPEVATAIGRLQDQIGALSDENQRIKGEFTQAQNMTSEEQHWNAISTVHPDFKSTLSSNSLKEFATQRYGEDYLTHVYKQGTASQINDLLTVYKRVNGNGTNGNDEKIRRRDELLKAAKKEVVPSGGRKSSPSQPGKRTIDDHLAFIKGKTFRNYSDKDEAAMDQAIREGRL